MSIEKKIKVEIDLDVDDIIEWIDYDASEKDIKKIRNYIDVNYVDKERIIKSMRELYKDDLKYLFDSIQGEFKLKLIKPESLQDELKIDILIEMYNKYTLQELEILNNK